MEKIAVIGVGQTSYGVHIDKSLGKLVSDSFNEALNDVDKGLDLKNVGAVFIGSLGCGGGQLGNLSALATDSMGLTGVSAVRLENACASSGFAFVNAAAAIVSGQCDIAIAGGVEKMRDTSGEQGRYWLGVSGDTEWERLAGTTFPGMYALMATRHMHEHGTTREQLAMVSVKNHKNGADNPKAQFQRAITLDRALNSPMVAYPLSLFDCCSTTDGASMVIFCRGDLAKKFTDTPVYLSGYGCGTDTLQLFSRTDLTTIRAAEIAANKAYQMADVKANDIDVAEVHDCFTIAEIMAYENLGFCKKGEGGKFIEEGHPEKNGKIPVNPSGGLKAKGHPIGATGTGQVYEIVKQLRGEVVKDTRQVAGAEIGLTHNVGGDGATAVVGIFRRL